MLYITALSYVLVLGGLLIRQSVMHTVSDLWFAGGFLAILGWVSYSYTHNIIKCYMYSCSLSTDWCHCFAAMV